MVGSSLLASTLFAAALLPHAFGSSLRQLLPTPHLCSIEHGFDFVGYDVGNAPGHVDTCCDKCYVTKDCKVWSWTDFNGGTCWFKSRRGEVVANANAKSALVYVRPPEVCQVHKDIDYVGNDLARVDAAAVDDCCDMCHKTPGCRAYTWSAFQGGSCFLKSKVTTVKFQLGVHSAEAYPEVYPQCINVQHGYEYVGHDIASARSTMAEGCCDVCKTTANCRAYSWTAYEGGTCWLKSRAGNITYSNNVASATVLPNPEAPNCLFEQDFDYEGSDLTNVSALDATQCCAICQDFDGCKAFTWSEFQGGRCWLKSGKGKTTAKTGVNSGIVRA